MQHFLVLIPMIVVGIVGSFLAGSIEDFITPQIQNLPNKIADCETIENENWKELCEKQKSTYTKGITLVNVAGFVSGFGVAGILINKISN